MLDETIVVPLRDYDDPGVRHIASDDDVFSLHFEVTAVLASTEKRSPIRFETKVASNGGVSVRS